MKTEQLTALRNKKSLTLWDRAAKIFVKIQFNKDCSFVCWKRFVSFDRKNWVCWNEFLNLKDIDKMLNMMAVNAKNENI